MSKKILSVDDSKTIRLIIQKAFRPYDCVISEASNGEEGLAMVAKDKPDVIILDLTMPVMDGYEMLSKLKAVPEHKSIPVIMLTAEAGKDNVLRIAKLGVRDYVVKPFKEEVIVEKVGKVFPLQLKPAAPKRYEDALQLMVVDDKPAIVEQVQKAVSHTTWKVEGIAQPEAALEACTKRLPDAVFVSLSLPNSAAYSFYQNLRAKLGSAQLPVFGMCLVAATEDQAKARQLGFSGVVTKPIAAEALEAAVCRALNLDASAKYFQKKESAIVLTFPDQLADSTVSKISEASRSQIMNAVESGLTKLVIDLSQLKSLDFSMVQTVLSVTEHCAEFSLKHALIGSESVKTECKKYEESQNWQIVDSWEQAAA